MITHLTIAQCHAGLVLGIAIAVAVPLVVAAVTAVVILIAFVTVFVIYHKRNKEAFLVSNDYSMSPTLTSVEKTEPVIEVSDNVSYEPSTKFSPEKH